MKNYDPSAVGKFPEHKSTLKAHMITGTDKFEGCVCLGRFRTALFSQAPWLQQFISFVSSSLFTYWMKRGVKSFVGHDVIMILFKYQRYFLPQEPAATSICEISKKGQFFTMGIYFRVWLLGWFGGNENERKKKRNPPHTNIYWLQTCHWLIF